MSRHDGESHLALGDGLLLLGMLMWLSVGVGPWWLGIVGLVTAWLLNGIGKRLLR